MSMTEQKLKQARGALEAARAHYEEAQQCVTELSHKLVKENTDKQNPDTGLLGRKVRDYMVRRARFKVCVDPYQRAAEQLATLLSSYAGKYPYVEKSLRLVLDQIEDEVGKLEKQLRDRLPVSISHKNDTPPSQ